MTGLYNRRYVAIDLRHQFKRFFFDSELTIVTIDFDNLLKINDTFDHAIGNMVLRAVADIVNSATRAPDLLALLGGKEFVVILLDTQQKVAI